MIREYTAVYYKTITQMVYSFKTMQLAQFKLFFRVYGVTVHCASQITQLTSSQFASIARTKSITLDGNKFRIL